MTSTAANGPSARATKAVIPVAGMGTRFLPATKAVPKELLPVVDKPALEYIVAEAARAGLADILMVTSAGKEAIANHFDQAPLLEAALERKGDKVRLDAIRRSAELARIHSVRQHTQRGLGDAVSYGETFVGDESFAVLLGDDMIDEQTLQLEAMLDVAEARGGAVLALIEVDPADVSKYGCATPGPDWDGGDIVPIIDLVEKPAAEDAPSNLAVIGRYVLPPMIFQTIREVGVGARGEVELTDAMRGLIGHGVPVHGVIVRGRRFDTGDRGDYLKAVVELATEHPELGPEFTVWLKEFVQDLQGG